MNQSQFRLIHATALDNARLGLRFADGLACTVDLTDEIARHPTLARLARRSVFEAVELDEWQRGVVFAGDDNLTLASDNLRALAIEQAGGCSHQRVVEWMHRHDLSLDRAAEALGLSRRMLAYYRSGEKEVPRTVALAMLGWEAQEARRAA